MITGSVRLKMDDASVTEQCAKCSAPLANDQRYCLQCGEPRPHVRMPQPDVPAAQKPSAPSVVPTIPSSPSPPSSRNNTFALLAGVGVLLLAMGVGVLIGRAGAGSAKAPPAQVISVGGTAGGASTNAAPTTAPTPQTPTEPSAAKQKAAKAKEPAGTGSSITKPAPPSAAAGLKSASSGQNYEQKSKNLPDVVGTG